MTEELTVGEIEDFLMHHGVKGMKWGHHSSGASGSGGPSNRAVRKAARLDASIARGQARLDKAGGSRAKAYGSVLGKSFVDSFVTNVAAQSISSIGKNHPSVQLGAHIAGSAVNMAINIRDAKRVGDIHRAIKANKKAGRAPGQGA